MKATRSKTFETTPRIQIIVSGVKLYINWKLALFAVLFSAIYNVLPTTIQSSPLQSKFANPGAGCMKLLITF